MGHPLGATGAMILGTLLDELERRNLRTAWPRCASAAAWAPPPSSSASDPDCRSCKTMTNIRIERADGIATLTFDMPAAGP